MTLTEQAVFDPNVIQHRTFTLEGIEVRDGEGDNASPVIRGHAAVFNEWAEIIPGLLRERVAPGTFKKTIREADVRALFNHNPDYVLGRNRADTLDLREDGTGLAVRIDPPQTTWADDLMVSMKRGDISQMSFGFKPIKWTEDRNEDGYLDVTLREVRLFDVSVVTFPAYPQTDAWARSAIDNLRHYLEPEPGSHSTLAAADWQAEIEEIRQWLGSE